MNQGLVSVIIPTRNRVAYLQEAIGSVYWQSYQNFEIIVIDDGSTDETAAVAGQYDSRLCYFHQSRKGVSAARNSGIAKARGQYIAFLDDDDIFLPAKLHDNVEYLSKHPDTIWLCSGFSFIDAKGAPLSRAPIIPAKPEVTLHDIAMFTFIHTSSVMVRKTNMESAGGFPEGARVSEDYHAWANILATGKGATLQKCLTLFRQHKGNTRLPYTLLFKENMRIIDKILGNRASACMPRDHYVQNLRRIISENLLYKRHYIRYLGFRLWLGI